MPARKAAKKRRTAPYEVSGQRPAGGIGDELVHLNLSTDKQLARLVESAKKILPRK
jgi:hypothetical protein